MKKIEVGPPAAKGHVGKYNKCRVCSTSIAPPPRARVSGIRATNFGDVIFVDHAEIQLRKSKYVVLLVLHVASNLLWATAQSSLRNKETIQALRPRRMIVCLKPL